jgi:hypothetical protein
MTRSGKTLRHASNVVRPAEIKEDSPEPPPTFKRNSRINYWKDKEVMVQIFQRLSVALRNKSLCVCKTWNEIGVTPSLWRDMDLTHQ